MYVTISEHLPKVVNMPEENEKCAKEMCTYKHMHVSIQSFIYIGTMTNSHGMMEQYLHMNLKWPCVLQNKPFT